MDSTLASLVLPEKMCLQQRVRDPVSTAFTLSSQQRQRLLAHTSCLEDPALQKILALGLVGHVKYDSCSWDYMQICGCNMYVYIIYIYIYYVHHK